jgi:TPR repeat protein
MAYDDGDGVAEDLEKAAFWYRKAAEQSFAGGEYLLGRAFCFGRGVPENITDGREWVTKAADQGYEPAHALLREFSN